jgi:hypothetical protein
MITAGFVNSMDFYNAAQMHRSAETDDIVDKIYAHLFGGES